MEPKRQISLVRRALAHVEHRTTDMGEGPSTVGVRTYVDEERFGREQERLFRGLPIPVAHVSQLPSPGSFITHDATGVPLLVVRGDDGEVSAFLNVCRHRGT